MTIEEPDADRYEQLRSARPDDDVEDTDDLDPREVPLDADPFDVADQHRTVPYDDDQEA